MSLWIKKKFKLFCKITKKKKQKLKLKWNEIHSYQKQRKKRKKKLCAKIISSNWGHLCIIKKYYSLYNIFINKKNKKKIK